MSETQKPTGQAQEKPLEKAVEEAATIGLEQRIERTVNEYVEKKLDSRFSTLEKSLDEKVEAILKAKEIEVEKALRKGFGLETDPVIHQSDLIAAIRKIQLENAETGKKTPAPLEKAGPEGTGTKEDPIDKLLKDYGMMPQGGTK